jgi:hypothetical protein
VQAAQRLLADDPPDLATARQAMGRRCSSRGARPTWWRGCGAWWSAPTSPAAPQPCALEPALRGALDLLQPECERLGVQVQWPTDSPAVQAQADPVALEQIVHNLLKQRAAGAGAGAARPAPPGAAPGNATASRPC